MSRGKKRSKKQLKRINKSLVNENKETEIINKGIEDKNVKEKDLKKETTNQTTKVFSVVQAIITIVSFGYVIINNINDTIYQSNCEEFYHIPGRYFKESVNDKLGYLIGNIVAIILIFIAVQLIKKVEVNVNKILSFSNIYAFLLAIGFGLLFGLIGLNSWLVIIGEIDRNNMVYDSLISYYLEIGIFILFISVVIVLVIMFINIITKIKNKVIKEAIYIITGIMSLIILLVIIFGTIFRLNWSVDRKTNYEIVTKDEQSYVVISSMNDYKILIVPYEIGTDGKYKFITSEYIITDGTDLVYTYVNTVTPPEVEWE